MILNPSPLTPEFIQARVEVDTLILNAKEAAALVSMTHPEIDTAPQRARAAGSCRQMIITRGGDPTLAITASGVLNIAPPQVIPADTVGAGDAFAGAFTVAFGSAMPSEDAIRFANLRGHWRRRAGERRLRLRGVMRFLQSWGGELQNGARIGAVRGAGRTC